MKKYEKKQPSNWALLWKKRVVITTSSQPHKGPFLERLQLGGCLHEEDALIVVDVNRDPNRIPELSYYLLKRPPPKKNKKVKQ